MQRTTPSIAAEEDGNDLVKVGTFYASMRRADKAGELIETGACSAPATPSCTSRWGDAQSPMTQAKGQS